MRRAQARLAMRTQAAPRHGRSHARRYRRRASTRALRSMQPQRPRQRPRGPSQACWQTRDAERHHGRDHQAHGGTRPSERCRHSVRQRSARRTSPRSSSTCERSPKWYAPACVGVVSASALTARVSRRETHQCALQGRGPGFRQHIHSASSSDSAGVSEGYLTLHQTAIYLCISLNYENNYSRRNSFRKTLFLHPALTALYGLPMLNMLLVKRSFNKACNTQTQRAKLQADKLLRT